MHLCAICQLDSCIPAKKSFVPLIIDSFIHHQFHLKICRKSHLNFVCFSMS